MSLIATGQGLRKQSQQAAETIARLESQRNMQQDALDAQAKAQEMSLYGTAMGIGGAYGVNKALAASGSKVGAVSSMPVSGDAVLSGGKLLVNSSPAVPQGVSGALANAANPAATGALATPVNTLGGVGASGSVTGGAVGATSTTSGALSGATGALGSTGGAAGSSGALSAIGTVAAPIAIALGAAFLLNKLFG